MSEVGSTLRRDWTKKLRDELISKSVILVLGLIGFIGSWLWGWFAAGGLTAIGSLPAGVIVASTVDCRDLKGDWASFEPAGGRFIIGAGSHAPNPGVSKSYAIFTKEGAEPGTGLERSTGGEEAHVLTEAEIPTHDHANGPYTYVLQSNGLYTVVQTDPGTSPNLETGAPLKSFGGGRAHNNIPPYIALYYCKKT